MLIKKESQRDFAVKVGLKARNVDWHVSNRGFYPVVTSDDGTVDYSGVDEFIVLKKEYGDEWDYSEILLEDTETTNKTGKEFKLTTKYERSVFDDVHYLFTKQETESEEIIKSK